MADVTVEQARAAAKRLMARNRDFQTLEKYLRRKAGIGKSPFRAGDSNDTHRQIGRQEQHQVLLNLINSTKGDDNE